MLTSWLWWSLPRTKMVSDTTIMLDIITTALERYIEWERLWSLPRAVSSLSRRLSQLTKLRKTTNLFTCKCSSVKLSGPMPWINVRLLQELLLLQQEAKRLKTLTELDILQERDFKKPLNKLKFCLMLREVHWMLSNNLKLKPTLHICKECIWLNVRNTKKLSITYLNQRLSTPRSPNSKILWRRLSTRRRLTKLIRLLDNVLSVLRADHPWWWMFLTVIN